MVGVIFCTETSRHVNYSVSNQHWTSSRKLLQWIKCAQNKFTLKYWSCHIFNVVHQLSSFCALCFAIFADAAVLLIFVLQTFSWNHSPIYFVSHLFPHLKHLETSALLCVEKGILVDIGLNLRNSVVLQFSNFAYSLKTSVSCVKLFSWKNFTLSRKEVPKAHYFCFLLLIQSSGVQQKSNKAVAASGPTIWTSTYGLEPVLRNRLLIEPSGWAQTVHMLTQCIP